MVSYSKKFAWTLLGALLLAGTAFGQATVSILIGNGQIVLQNNTGSNPLVVVVRDAAGNPIPNAKVVWSITGVTNQTGSVLLATTTTDASGTSGGAPEQLRHDSGGIRADRKRRSVVAIAREQVVALAELVDRADV